MWEQNKIVPSEGVRAVGRNARLQNPHLATKDDGCMLMAEHTDFSGWKWCIGEEVRKPLSISEIVYSLACRRASYALYMEVIKWRFVAYIEAALANNFHKVFWIFLLGLTGLGHSLQQKEELHRGTNIADVSW